jgi:hypothetical protein
MAKEKDDEDVTRFDCQLLVGPEWEEIYQCSSHVSIAVYKNFNSDQDDWQGWIILSDYYKAWEKVQQGSIKRIRLNFTLGQYGQNTHLTEVTYHAIATGELAASQPIPVPCDRKIELGDVSSSGGENDFTVIDGNDNTYWESTLMVHPSIKVYPSSPPKKVCRVDIRWRNSWQHYFRISLLAGGNQWIDVFYGKSTGNPNVTEKYEFTEQWASGV